MRDDKDYDEIYHICENDVYILTDEIKVLELGN